MLILLDLDDDAISVTFEQALDKAKEIVGIIASAKDDYDWIRKHKKILINLKSLTSKTYIDYVYVPYIPSLREVYLSLVAHVSFSKRLVLTNLTFENAYPVCVDLEGTTVDTLSILSCITFGNVLWKVSNVNKIVIKNSNLIDISFIEQACPKILFIEKRPPKVLRIKGHAPHTMFSPDSDIEQFWPISKFKLSNLEELYVSEISLDISECAKNMPNLKIIDISKSYTTCIRSLEGLDLEEFIASRTQITDFSPISKMRNLKRINLSGNNLETISFLEGLTNLTDVDLSGNRLIYVDELASFTQLCSLNLEYNPVFDLRFLSSLENLVSVRLGNTYAFGSYNLPNQTSTSKEELLMKVRMLITQNVANSCYIGKDTACIYQRIIEMIENQFEKQNIDVDNITCFTKEGTKRLKYACGNKIVHEGTSFLDLFSRIWPIIEKHESFGVMVELFE